MLSNNNKKVVSTLSKRSFKENKKRNGVAIIAIILTTFMISTVFSIGISFAKNLGVMSTRLNGTKANITMTHPTGEQVEKIKGLNGVKSAGLVYHVGSIPCAQEDKSGINLMMFAVDSEEWNENIVPAIGKITGTFPKEEKEIIVSVNTLKQLGIENPQVGQTVTLEYKSHGEKIKKDFVLSGWFDTYMVADSSGLIYLGDTAYKQGEYSSKLEVYASDSKLDYVYAEMEAMADRKADQQVSATFTSFESSTKGMVAAVIVMIVLFIIVSGYLLIYNIMYISVTKDIQFYGRLKTIGTSSKQLKRIVYSQFARLSVLGIPVGIGLSVLTSFAIVPFALRSFSNDSAIPTDISFNPIIFIGSALFSLLTVAISCRKPAKIAGKVSPVEALKYSGVSEKINIKNKKSTSGGKLYKMAFRNVFREKKRAFIVFVSLFMGIVTFLSVSGFFSSLDVKNYIDNYAPWDFEYKSTPPLGEVKFDKDFLAAINKLDGVTKKEIVKGTYCQLDFDEEVLEPILRYEYIHYAMEYGQYENMVNALKNINPEVGYGTWFFEIDKRYVEEYNKKYDDKIDVKAFENGDICVLGYGDYTNMKGRQLAYTAEANGNSGKAEIGGVFQTFSDCDVGVFSHVVGSVHAVFVSESFMKKLDSNAIVTQIGFNVKESKEESIRNSLTALNESLKNRTFSYSSRHDMVEEFSSSMASMRIITSGISFVLIFIGIINFINVMSTGIYSRRTELAVLESVGMTKRQIKKMLALEGSYYAAITSALILTLGNGALALIAKVIPYIADYAKFVYPVSTVAVLICIIFAICVAVPPIVYKSTSKESVTQRLYSTDN